METTRRDLSWKELVMKSWGKEYNAPDIAYVFSGGRTFQDRPMTFESQAVVSLEDYAQDYAQDYYL